MRSSNSTAKIPDVVENYQTPGKGELVNGIRKVIGSVKFRLPPKLRSFLLGVNIDHIGLMLN